MGRTSKFRGSRTHGRGKKAGRGAGKRGGRGNAGLHKHRYITTVKDMPDHFGRRGFYPHGRRGDAGETISLRALEGRVDALVAQGETYDRVIRLDLCQILIHPRQHLLGAVSRNAEIDHLESPVRQQPFQTVGVAVFHIVALLVAGHPARSH